MASTVTRQQVIRIRAAVAKRFGADDDAYRAFLYTSFPRKHWADSARPSTLELTAREGDQIIRALSDGRATRPNASRGTGTRTKQGDGAGAHLTEKQAHAVDDLIRRTGWTPEQVTACLRRQTGKLTFVSALSRTEATKVISGLQAVIRDRQSA